MQQQKQSRGRWVYRMRPKLATVAVIALVCFIGYGAIFGTNGFLAFHRKVMDSQKLEREIQALQQESVRRQQTIKALKSQPQAIEKEAREQLRYARPGEVVYTLPTPQPTPSSR